MATTKTLPTLEVWDIVAPRIIPAGLPKDPGEPVQETDFLGGYPDEYIDPMTLVWYADFTPEADAQWEKMVKRARRRVEEVGDEADPYTDVLKQWRDRSGPATDAQRDAVLDAMMNLWRLNLKEED